MKLESTKKLKSTIWKLKSTILKLIEKALHLQEKTIRYNGIRLRWIKVAKPKMWNSLRFLFLIYLRPSRLPKCWDTVRNMKWEYWYMDGTKGAYYPPQCQVEAWESFPVPGKTLPWPCGCAPYKMARCTSLGLFRHSWSPKPGSGLDRSRQPHLKKENGKVPPHIP